MWGVTQKKVLEAEHDDPAFRMRSHRQLLMLAWFGSPTARHVGLIDKASRAMVRAYQPGKTALLNLIVSGAPKFDDEVRKGITKLIADGALNAVGGAHVMLIPGVAGSAVRAFMSTALLLARPAAPNKSFGEVRAAAEWLAPKLAAATGEAWTATEIIEASTKAMARSA